MYELPITTVSQFTAPKTGKTQKKLYDQKPIKTTSTQNCIELKYQKSAQNGSEFNMVMVV